MRLLGGPGELAAGCAGVVAVALFVAGVPLRFSQLHSICTAADCARGQLTPDGLGALQRLGIPLGLYAAYDISLDLEFAAGYCAVGCLLLWRTSPERITLFVAPVLLTFGLALPDALQSLSALGPGWGLLARSLNSVGFVSFFLLFYVFPDGRFVPAWTRWLVIPWGAQEVTWLFPELLAVPPILDVWT